MDNFPRVVLFADTFYETNGAANVIRRLRSFAEENDRPFLCVLGGKRTELRQEGNLTTLELKRGALSVPIDGELKYDPFLWRFKNLVGKTLEDFKPDLIHVTGLNDVSQIGFYFAHFRKIPAVASWHTNTHEYAARRALCLLPSFAPAKFKKGVYDTIERTVFTGLMKLYFLAQMQLAPNTELVETIRRKTRRPTHLMSRGVDTELFTPEKRTRAAKDDVFRIGYVGRLQPEKNVRFLARVDEALREKGAENYKFVIVGEGSEDNWLRKNIARADLKGVLHGDELACAYADMDLLIFPSRTDAFGNVVLEALAAGVPAVVMPDGGPKYLICENDNGHVALDDEDFIATVVRFVENGRMPLEMRAAARDSACSRSWKTVFDEVYKNYGVAAKLDKNIRLETVERTA